ncbi:diguanylate cyclase/phosphodiesterase [gut metagenome]|uniref:Diguanylate cyclase/phosphodiesterase n=1 Tax=gut metagenome TaxID=749906 RepID=J9GQ93_9ZZZZ
MEITEDAKETNKQAAFSNIAHCKNMGFRIALDDAGDGYTSIADLRDYPIDVVKIDRSILNSAVTSRGAALLRGITFLVHSLDMRVLCEGVETKEQADMLRDLGCDYIQGYYFYRPLPLKEIDRILK